MESRSKTEPLFVGILDAGDMLGVGRSSIYRLIHDGKLKAIKLGTRRLVPTASIRELADALGTANGPATVRREVMR